MTADQKFTWGLVMSIGGLLSLFMGVGISFTLIGACLGVPMALVGLPISIWGSVWIYQARFQRAQQAIASGVAAGIKEGREAGGRREALPPMAFASLPPTTAPVRSLAPIEVAKPEADHQDGHAAPDGEPSTHDATHDEHKSP